MIDPITPFKIQKVLDLCSGIGGFTLGHLISGGFETVAFCEINSYCQQVLNLRFPHIPIIPDIHDITTESLYGVGVTKVDGIIAGLPCPPFSLAGKRLASQDSRNLFGEFFRNMREIRPQWAIVENVPGLITAESGQFFHAVLWEFASLGFHVEWGVLSANQVGAVHKRERIWIIAYSQSPRRDTSWNQYEKAGTNAASVGCGNHCNFQRSSQSDNSVEYKARAIAQRTFSGGDDGFPARLDGCFLGVTGLTDWLCASTIPSFNRLTRNEVAALTPNCQKEYRQLYAEYFAIRRQQTEQIRALGNAIVPQCAALIFEHLKRILSQQQKDS
ncbi:DNA cytosine methyltransferase [Nostoc linckia FACHB-391]|uniref:Cytosine-specific methyltransferase n=1 Tax=Nostoc linckia FACHB-391 TaxID=2692906 RepID=A0ABR8F7J0_NOSLI|nr:DNA cytosine methyltransferase [Nostoc linckia]MBD2566173.1 DNA cytosine methyltransferase [Nostoc linckia FACHB-391]